MADEVPSHTTSRSPYACTAAKHLALSTPPTTIGGQATPTATLALEPCLKWLTTAEMAVKHECGKCYNCTEKFTKEYLEVCPMKGIFLLELNMPEPTDPLDDTVPQISLNAITGISPAETVKLLMHLYNTIVTALIDSGSTHSFISTEVASYLHLEALF
jgi:hypothetical protein